MNEELSADAVAKLLSDGGAINLSDRAKFSLTGGDRARYLSGQVTQDVKGISDSATVYSCVTNHKGKMDGYLFITSGSGAPESFLLDTDPVLRESLFARLERYIIADDAELIDVTADWHLIHILGGHSLPEKYMSRTCNRYGAPGRDYWIPATVEISLLLSNIPTIDQSALEIVRIMNGVPKWGAELSPDVLPPEAKLESRAISYTKGCYIGQEVISRIRSVGRVNRTLECIEATSDAPLAAGMILLIEGGKEVGQITSAAFHPGHPDGPRWIGLAMIRRGSSDPGTHLIAQSPASSASDSGQIVLSSSVEVRNTPVPSTTVNNLDT